MGSLSFACRFPFVAFWSWDWWMSSCILKGLMVWWTLRVAPTCSCRDGKQGAYWPSRSKGPRQREGERGSEEVWDLEGDQYSLYLPGRAKAPKCRKHNDCLCWLEVCWCLWFSSFCLLYRGRQKAWDARFPWVQCSVLLGYWKIILICWNANSRGKCGAVA